MSSLVQTNNMAGDTLKKRKRDGSSETKLKKKVSIQEGPAQHLGAQGPSVIRVSSVVLPQFSSPVVGMWQGSSRLCS